MSHGTGGPRRVIRFGAELKKKSRQGESVSAPNKIQIAHFLFASVFGHSFVKKKKKLWSNFSFWEFHSFEKINQLIIA